MANSKISALTSATTPLAGTETLPVVQSSTTRQVSVANLTAGRSISASGVTVTGLTASRPVFTDGSFNLTSSGTVPTNQGGTGLTSFTANGVVYASSTSALATGTAFTFTGTYAGINASSPNTYLQINSSISGADATHPGSLQFSEQPTSLAARSGIEWKTSAFASGYGWKITSIDSSGVQLVIGTRQNNAAWTEVARFQSNNDFKLNTGNLIQGTAAKGVNFTANTPAAGMTSQLLNWYEEGTFTPTDASGAGLTFTSATGKYTRIGRQVSVQLAVEYPTTANSNNTAIGGLPFTSANDGRNSCGVVLGNANILSVANVGPNTSVINLFDGANLNNRTNSQYSARSAIINLIYTV